VISTKDRHINHHTYYIIDDFSVLAVRARFIQELPSLFPPADVIDIDDVTIANLASESEESSRERTRCGEKLKVLEHGLEALQGVQDISPVQQGVSLRKKRFYLS
jgi:hypothetical protein